MIDLQTFKSEIFLALENKPPQWRKGQFVFNYIDGKYAIARELQFNKGIDCFYDDSVIDKFIEAAYDTLVENGSLKYLDMLLESGKSISEEYQYGFFRG